MTQLIGTTPLSAPISPGTDDRNTWPTHKAMWGQGGLKLVKSIVERDKIEDDRRYQTMVFVESGASGKAEWYYWNGEHEDGLDGAWVEWTPSEVSLTPLNQAIAALQTGQRVLESNINQKPNGIHIEDHNRNTLDNLAGIVFGKGVNIYQDTQKPTMAHVDVGTAIEVMNGQSDASTSVTAEALEFPDAILTTRNNGKIAIVKLPDSGGGTSVTTEIDLEVSNVGGDYYTQQTKAIDTHWPLKFEQSRRTSTDADPDRVVLTMDHASFEPIHAPSFLAYLKDEVEVLGNSNHRAGTLWFEDVIVSGSPYLSTERDTKSYSIEEADRADPNVTGGTTYIIALRAAMKGTAPDDGFVSIYLYNSSIDPYDPTGYLMDDNKQPMAVTRQYKAGEKLESLEVVGAVTAKASQSFTCHVVHNFTSDNIVLCDPVEDITGLMIQAITSTSSTGDALQQYELDTQDDIVFVKHYLGVDRATLKWFVQRPIVPFDVPAGSSAKDADGWAVYAVGPVVQGVEDGHVVIKDNGKDIADFTFGKVFSAEETKLMRGKDIDVSVTLTDKDDAFTVVLMKWIGQPDEYTADIFKSRNNDSPVLSPGWEKVGEMFATEDPVSGDHTVAKTFVVPTDINMNNYGVFIYPVGAQMPITLKLKELNVSTDPAFTGVAMREVRKYKQKHMLMRDTFKQFTQDTQGFASLRYTITNAETPCPVGIPGKGFADVSLDDSVNRVPTSSAKGGEGAIVFKTSGTAKLTTQLRLWSDKPAGEKHTVKFWWAKVVGDSFEKIDDSEGVFEVVGGAKSIIYRMPTLKLDVIMTDRLALRMEGDVVDAAFLESVKDSEPMVQVNLEFNELSS